MLTLEREITRVRGEVEQLQGRLHVLDGVTAMSTVNLEISEIKEFVPGEPVSYRTRVRRAWEESLAALLSVGQSLSVLLVALSPWVGVLLPAFAGGDSRATGALGTKTPRTCHADHTAMTALARVTCLFHRAFPVILSLLAHAFRRSWL